MTYFGFLARFLGIPILLLAALVWLASRRRARPASWFRYTIAPFVVGLHILLALVYTTPWDNYLVATRVWWYDPALVTGITLGWVPIEEYTFFILQPILTSLWLLLLGRFLPPSKAPFHERPRLRYLALSLTALLWLLFLTILVAGWQPGTYLALELVWALPPIALQLFYGADILWHYRRLVLVALLTPTLYLSAADALAIQSGTWTINPAQSLDLHLFGILPVEELLFFLLTNTLIVFGVTLSLATESEGRLRHLREQLLPRRQRAARSAD